MSVLQTELSAIWLTTAIYQTDPHLILSPPHIVRIYSVKVAGHN